MLRGSSPCTDLSLVVRCDYVNERVNVKLALSFCTTWLNILLFLLLLLTIGHETGHYCHFRVLHSVNGATGRKKKKRERVLEKKEEEKNREKR